MSTVNSGFTLNFGKDDSSSSDGNKDDGSAVTIQNDQQLKCIHYSDFAVFIRPDTNAHYQYDIQPGSDSVIISSVSETDGHWYWC